jgi:hypothetical protein
MGIFSDKKFGDEPRESFTVLQLLETPYSPMTLLILRNEGL